MGSVAKTSMEMGSAEDGNGIRWPEWYGNRIRSDFALCVCAPPPGGGGGEKAEGRAGAGGGPVSKSQEEKTFGLGMGENVMVVSTIITTMSAEKM